MRFARMPLLDQLVVIEAATCLAAARFAVARVPFAHLSRVLGALGHESPACAEPAAAAVATRVRGLLAKAARGLPWRSTCLMQASAGKVMLARRGVPSTLYLGVRRGSTELEAHAWLRVGDLAITGGGGDDFTVIARYA